MEGAIDTEIIAIGVGVAPIITLLLAPIKKYVPNSFMVYIAISVALAWTLVFHWTQDTLERETIMATIMLGVVTGLAASGTYSAFTSAMSGYEKIRDERNGE